MCEIVCQIKFKSILLCVGVCRNINPSAQLQFLEALKMKHRERGRFYVLHELFATSQAWSWTNKIPGGS